MYSDGGIVFSITGDSSDEGSSVAGCSTVVGSVMIGDSVVLVGDIGTPVHPTSVTITIKVQVARNMVAPCELGHPDIDLDSLKRTKV